MLDDQVKSLHWARSACQSDARYFPSQIAYARALAHEGKSREAQKAIAEARRLFPALDRDYVIGFMGEWVCKDLEQADIALS